ncbi:MAG TPA: DedA family protein [Patescibacteria group bacterium]|nr:DedA family protein [Patescibacteria group bacterium]
MFNIDSLIQTGGLLLIAVVIFAESGMFIGFFFPGDTLLLGAGVIAATGKLNLVSLIPVIAIAAIAGDNTGYQIGRRFGRRLFSKKDSLFFKQEHVAKAEQFYEKYGAKTMLFAHFFPVIRTFVPPVAGVARMRYSLFVLCDAIGDTAWAFTVTLIGYWFGSKIHNLDHYILLAVIGVMVFTLAPTIIHFAKVFLENKKLT